MIARRTILLGGIALAACRRTDQGGDLHVLAAASLTDVLALVAADFVTTQGGSPPQLVFDASSRLATQIENGAPADVFVSADLEWMDALAEKHLLVDDTRVELLGNRLVVVVPKDAARAPASVPELVQLERLALAGEAVPAGRYARAALEQLGVLAALAPKIVAGDNVRTALSWVARREAPAAIVYATDAASEPAVRVAFEIPADSHPRIVYPIAVLRGATQPARARAFVDFCRSEVAESRFRAAGFTAP
ncbi:MAG TPA: molybdate ABC transporter substrate-binding protein [Nannocystaceae bacterium]|nr:molybdate ABC transporter substrate-binding protein [Nannocystaceae bacterium]